MSCGEAWSGQFQIFSIKQTPVRLQKMVHRSKSGGAEAAASLSPLALRAKAGVERFSEAVLQYPLEVEYPLAQC